MTARKANRFWHRILAVFLAALTVASFPACEDWDEKTMAYLEKAKSFVEKYPKEAIAICNQMASQTSRDYASCRCNKRTRR